MQLPNYCFYNGDTKKPVGFMLSDIVEDSESGRISFMISPDESMGVNVVRWKKDEDTNKIYDLQGRRILGQLDQLKRGIYVTHGNKIMVK